MGSTRRSVFLGIAAGIGAGAVLFAVEAGVAAAVGEPVETPLRQAASLVLGRSGLTSDAGGVLIAGAVVWLLLSAGFGALWGGFDTWFTDETRRSLGRQAVIGVAFGAVLWLVGFELLGRYVYPWFQDVSRISAVTTRTIAFGVPLGIFYALGRRLGEKRAPSRPSPPVKRAPPPAGATHPAR